MGNEKRLAIIVVIFAITFTVQFSTAVYQKPDRHGFASWKHNPKSLAEAKRLAKHIVTGVVTDVERGDDLVVKAQGEPNGEDRIPIEVATVKVETRHKGGDAASEI